MTSAPYGRCRIRLRSSLNALSVRHQKLQSMKLRSASARDVETLFEIRCSVRENHQSREELASLDVTAERVKGMIESGDYITTIAEIDGRAVGFTMAQISEGYIFACFVRPEFEGLGIGQALMDAAEEGLWDAGVRQAWLSTGPEHDLRAVGFYRHLGWIEEGYRDDGQIKFVKALQAHGSGLRKSRTDS